MAGPERWTSEWTTQTRTGRARVGMRKRKRRSKRERRHGIKGDDAFVQGSSAQRHSNARNTTALRDTLPQHSTTQYNRHRPHRPTPRQATPRHFTASPFHHRTAPLCQFPLQLDTHTPSHTYTIQAQVHGVGGVSAPRHSIPPSSVALFHRRMSIS